MAQFLKAKFLSEALKWKANPRHAADQYFAGLRYDPYIYAQARLIFPEYNKRFPSPANKEFTENFAKDLANPTRNQQLLKIINPVILTPELEAANSQFEVSARLEQQSVAQATGQSPAQPFSLTAERAPAIPRIPTPSISVPPTTTIVSETKQPSVTPATPTQAAPATEVPPVAPPQPEAKIGRPPIQVPRIPPSLSNTAKNLGSRAGVFFQRNVGKYFTVGRVATVVSSGIGAITGGALTNGSPLGILGGGGLGAIAPAWIRSGEGTRFLGRLGNGAINAGVRISNQVSMGTSRPSASSASKKRALGLLGILLLFVIVAGALGGLPGITPTPPTTGTIPGATNISSCKFTRAGNSQLIKSSTLAGWISQAAASAGIPPAILASVAMHESPSFVASADDNHDAIKNNYYYFVNPEGNTRAIGITQISTGRTLVTDKDGNPMMVDHCQALLSAGGTFQKAATALGKKIQDKDYYCVSDIDERVRRFCQTDNAVLNTALYTPSAGVDNSYLSLCRITDNLAVGAAILSGKLGSGSWTNQNDAQGAIRGYYGKCSYDGGDYCTEAWNDYQNCQAQANPSSNSVVQGGHSCVTNATFVPFPGYSNIQPGNYSYVCGHCLPIYNAIDTGVNSAGGTQVLAVTDGTSEDNTNPVGGTAIWLTGKDGRNYYYAHLQKGSLITGEVKAGQVIGAVASASDTSSGNNGIAHVHFSAGTPGNRQSLSDPANIPAGPLLDSWCNNNVCNGKPNVAYNCGQQ